MSARHFGLQSSRVGLGGMSADAATTRGSKYAPRDSNSLPPSPSYFISTPPSPALERGQFAQAAIDVLTFGVWIFLGLLAAAIVGGPVIALGWMFFFR